MEPNGGDDMMNRTISLDWRCLCICEALRVGVPFLRLQNKNHRKTSQFQGYPNLEQPLESLSEPQRARTPSQKQKKKKRKKKSSFGPMVPEPPNHPKRKRGISPSNSAYTGLSFFENTPKIVVSIFGVPLKQLKKGYIPSNKDRPQ